MIKKLTLTLALLCATPAAADCYADYKAKQEDPLRLHYGVIELPERACNANAARRYIAGRIDRDDWQLLNVISVFDESELAAKRREAGQYYLRY
ncbi:hypothetical protein [Halocynthiibacter sp.]|uniref:hypothetical protein n=1 Tax=Halocynthiibacter sp. TaxID=1979210 RepID=UPI003C5EB36C